MTGLSHFSPEYIDEIRSVEQPMSQEGWLAPNKPVGLWVSVDGEDDWPSWCQAESFGNPFDGVRYRVILSAPDRLLWIDNATDLMLFTDRYDKPCEIRDYRFPKGRCIDWRRVATDYSGIIIAPYQWSCRLRDGTYWYYGWDCASGCIWDAEVIERLEEET